LAQVEQAVQPTTPQAQLEQPDLIQFLQLSLQQKAGAAGEIEPHRRLGDLAAAGALK
jgi:hypothetical protein